MKTKWLLWSVWVVAVLFVAVQPARCEKIEGIKNLRFIFSSDAIVDGIEIFELTCDDECIVEIKNFGCPYDIAEKKTVSDEQVKEIIDILNKYEVWEWDGFNEYDTNAKDGENFSFSLLTQDDKTIYASGYEKKSPEHYEDVVQELFLIFEVEEWMREMSRHIAEDRIIYVPVPITIEDIWNLSYSTGGDAVNSGVIYELTCGDKCTVKIKLDGEPYEEAKTYLISDEQVKELIDLFNEYEVWRWNGFNEHNPDVFDGGTFSFSLTVQNGKKINAYGYMMYPEHFGEVIPEMIRILDEGKGEEVNKEEGDNGILVPVIIGAGVFIIVLVVIGIVRRRR